MREVITTSILTRKTAFFDGWSWFRFNNLGLALGTNWEFYTSVAKGLKLKVRKFLGLIPTFAEMTGEKLVGGGLFGHTPPPPPPSSILNRVKAASYAYPGAERICSGSSWYI